MDDSEQMIKNDFKEFVKRQIDNLINLNYNIEYNFHETTKYIECNISNKTIKIYGTYKKYLSDVFFTDATFNYIKTNLVEIDNSCEIYDPFIKNEQVEHAEAVIKKINNSYYHLVYNNEYIFVHLIFPSFKLEIIKRIYIK